MAIYYDYKKDYPKGNGWDFSAYKYLGEIISSPEYVFPRGKYQGKSLQYIVEYCWRGIIKYIDYGLIFISRECFQNLQCSKNKLALIEAANDSKLNFCKIYDITDELYTKPLACSHQGNTFVDVAIEEPKYLANIINRAINPHYGRNQHYYARDRSKTLFAEEDSIKELERLIEQFEYKNINNIFTNALHKMKDDLIQAKKDYEDEIYDYWQKETDRYAIEEGLRCAYEDDPDALWNTD